jgi:hypothetical protein
VFGNVRVAWANFKTKNAVMNAEDNIKPDIKVILYADVDRSQLAQDCDEAVLEHPVLHKGEEVLDNLSDYHNLKQNFHSRT